VGLAFVDRRHGDSRLDHIASGEATLAPDRASVPRLSIMQRARVPRIKRPISQDRVWQLPDELCTDFMKALTDEVGMNLHLNLVSAAILIIIVERRSRRLARKALVTMQRPVASRGPQA